MFKRSTIYKAVITAMMISAPSYVMAAEKATDSDDIEVIEIKGMRSSLVKAMDLKREEVQIVDSIVAEDIGKFPDNNVVEALQRVPGIQVTDRASGETNAVSIRGLSDVTTTINGRQIFISTGRGYALADTPAALLAGVDVYKTRSASQVETGIAGQIDVRTQRPFNFDGVKVVAAAKGVYQDQADSTDPHASFLVSNTWESGLGKFGALVNVSYSETNWRDENITSGAAVPFAGANPSSPLLSAYQQINTTYVVDGQEMTAWVPGTLAGLPTAAGSTINVGGVDEEYFLARDAVFASDFTGKRERPAANISLQFAPNDSSEYLFEAFYNGYRSQSFNSLFFTFVNPNGTVNLDDSYTVYEGTNVIKERTVYNAGGFNSGDAGTGKTDSFVYALGGKWDLNEDLKIESEVVYQQSTFESEFFATRWNPRHRVGDAWVPGYHTVEVDFNNGNGVPSLIFPDDPSTEWDESDLTNPEAYTIGTAWDNGGKDEGESITFTLDGEWLVDFGGISQINFGTRFEQRTAIASGRGARMDCSNNEDIGFYCDDIQRTHQDLAFINDEFFDDRAVVPESWVIGDGNHLFAEREFYREGFGFSEFASADMRLYDNGVPTIFSLNLSENMNSEETSLSFYAEAQFYYDTDIGEFDGSIGARYSEVKTEGTYTQACRDPQVNPADDNAFDVSTIIYCKGESVHESDKILPTAIVRYTFLEDWMARFAYTETIRRPDFGSFNPLRSYFPDVTDVGYGTAWQGNSNLKPVESANLDISLEYYFGEGNAIYTTWFQRDIDGLFIDTTRSISIEGADYPFVLSQPNNEATGSLEGVEVGVTYYPEELPGILNGLGFQASYTQLEASQVNPLFSATGEAIGTMEEPMFGVSPDSYNIKVMYETEKFSANWSYVYREAFKQRNEARLFANPLAIWRRPETSIDVQFTYDITDQVTVTLDATNITNELYQEYYEEPDLFNFYTGNYSRTVALGIRYSM